MSRLARNRFGYLVLAALAVCFVSRVYAGTASQIIVGALEQVSVPSSPLGSHASKIHPLEVVSIAFDPSGKQLAVASIFHGAIGSQIEILAVPQLQPLTKWIVETATVRSVAFSLDGRLLAAVGLQPSNPDSGGIFRWETTQWKPLPSLPGDKHAVKSMAFSGDGKQFATLTDGAVALWDATTWKNLKNLETTPDSAKGDSVFALAFSRVGSLFAEGGDGVRVRDLISGRVLMELPRTPGFVNSLSFSPDGKHLAAGGQLGCQLWELDSAPRSRPLFAIPNGVCPRGIFAVSFAPDGKTLLAGGHSYLGLQVIGGGRQELLSKGHFAVVSVGFSPEGQSMASALRMSRSSDNTAKDQVILWEAASGKQLGTFDIL